MQINQPLWILKFSTPVSAASFLSEALEKYAVAVTVLAPPREEDAQIEAIFDHDPDEDDIKVKLSLLAAAAETEISAVTIEEAPKTDWLKKVCEDFPPVTIGRWTVHGALHREKVSTRLWALQIDATNAFGTGEHPTTRGCLLLLHKLLKSGYKVNRLADIGCGSGILAMACMQKARSLAVAIDLDPDSVQIAKSNARINGLGNKIRVARGCGYEPGIVEKNAPYDLIMSNIFAGPLCQMAWKLKNSLQPGGVAILSGLLTTQARRVVAAHRAQGLTLMEHKIIGEWSVLAFQRPKRA